MMANRCNPMLSCLFLDREYLPNTCPSFSVNTVVNSGHFPVRSTKPVKDLEPKPPNSSLRDHNDGYVNVASHTFQ